MHPIPTPQLLDPDRPLANDRGGFSTADDNKPRTELLDKALHDTCAYARQLWENLAAARQYLFDSLPPDPRTPGPHASLGASPTGPGDEQGWQNWIAAYASVTSVLCGPHGDSGFGLREARGAAEQRRTAPNLLMYAHHPELRQDGAAATDSAGPPLHPGRGPDSSSASPAAPAARSSKPGALRPAVTAVLVGLALRGLHPRRWRACDAGRRRRRTAPTIKVTNRRQPWNAAM